MAILVPINRGTNGPAHFTQQIALEGTTYTLEFRWNVRLSAWLMTVLDSEGVTPLLVGRRLVADYPIAQELVDRQPPGYFLAVDTGGPDSGGDDPGFDDLGNRVQLHYVESSEF